MIEIWLHPYDFEVHNRLSEYNRIFIIILFNQERHYGREILRNNYDYNNYDGKIMNTLKKKPKQRMINNKCDKCSINRWYAPKPKK